MTTHTFFTNLFVFQYVFNLEILVAFGRSLRRQDIFENRTFLQTYEKLNLE